MRLQKRLEELEQRAASAATTGPMTSARRLALITDLCERAAAGDADATTRLTLLTQLVEHAQEGGV